MEILDQIVNAILLQFAALILVGLYQSGDHVFVIDILSQGVLAKELKTVQDVLVCKPKEVEGDSRIQILDASCVEVLHHQQVRIVRPVFDVNFFLCGLLHSVHEHV